MTFRSHLKTLTKLTTYRTLGALDTFGLTYLMTGKVTAAIGVMTTEVLTKSFIYYGHERAWEGHWVAKLFGTTAETETEENITEHAYA